MFNLRSKLGMGLVVSVMLGGAIGAGMSLGTYIQPEKDASKYFSKVEGKQYVYEDEVAGREYIVTTERVQEDKVQRRKTEPDYESVEVVEVGAQEVVKINEKTKLRGDGEKDLITKGKREHIVLLKAPIKEGTRWALPYFNHESVITAVDKEIETGFGKVKTVEVTTKAPHTDVETREYYAEGIGLVYKEYKEGGTVKKTKLVEIKKGE